MTHPPSASEPSTEETARGRSWPPAAGVLGAVIFLLVGWAGLLVPSLVRSIEATFVVSDATIGIYYLLTSIAYAGGAFAGGHVTERIGRRPTLVAGAVLLGVGLLTLGTAATWNLFLAGAVPVGLGLGVFDGGVNGLFLDVFRDDRGRALNLLHLCFSLGALSAPLVVGWLVDAGVGWQAVPLATSFVAFAMGACLLVAPMPHGRRHDVGSTRGQTPGSTVASPLAELGRPLLLLCLSIGFYIASEVGVTDWLVRFLASAPLQVATGALSLYWAGLAVGRLVSARIADRFDHLAYTIAAGSVMSIALAGAILVPNTPVSIALFGVAGLAAGPIAPMLFVLGGDRYPDRSAMVGGYLTAAAVIGSIGYPTVMGFLSVTVGLTVAMLGTVVFGLASAAVLLVVGRIDADRTPADRTPADRTPGDRSPSAP